MQSYNYPEAVLNDVQAYIRTHIDLSAFSDLDELEDYLNKVLQTSGCVIRYDSELVAENNISHNLWLLELALEEYGYDSKYLLTQGAKACDKLIRLFLLSGAISEALMQIEERITACATLY